MKSGFVSVAGRPNVGKSTLVNALCGGKVAIVSDKPQTTRQRIFGIANGDDYQLVLADLPGFQRPRDALTERMQRTVDQSFEEVDAVLFVLSARERIGAGDRFIAVRDPEDTAPRRLRLVGDDRDLAAAKSVYERRLADVRTTRNRDEAGLHASGRSQVSGRSAAGV